MGQRIQYKGTSDIVRLEPGENWSGRLADPLTKRVEWNRQNNHIVDTELAGLSDEAIELILEDTDRFQDVTGLKRIPANGFQKMWLGVSESQAAPKFGNAQDAVVEPVTKQDDLGQGEQPIGEEENPSTDQAANDKSKAKSR